MKKLKQIGTSLAKKISRHEPLLTEYFLRVATAIALLFPAIDGFFYPESWIGFFPEFVRALPLNDVWTLHLFAGLEIAIALWILLGRRILLPSLVACGMIMGIVTVNLKFIDLVFRDISIALIPLVLAIRHASDK